MHTMRRPGADRLAPMVAAIGLAFAASAGCGGGGPPVPAAEDRAREVLSEALSGWQRGDSIEDLKQASPSIIVADLRWSEGARLAKFEVQGEGKPAGAERLFTVRLWLAGEQGKEVAETVEYKVGTNPILTVFRSLF